MLIMYRFGAKRESKQANIAPGPGAYDTRPSIGNEGVKPTMSSRITPSASAKTLATPGPGTYEPSIIKHKAPAYRLGTENRTKEKVKTEPLPGPGSYEPNYKISKSNLPKWK